MMRSVLHCSTELASPYRYGCCSHGVWAGIRATTSCYEMTATEAAPSVSINPRHAVQMWGSILRLSANTGLPIRRLDSQRDGYASCVCVGLPPRDGSSPVLVSQYRCQGSIAGGPLSKRNGFVVPHPSAFTSVYHADDNILDRGLVLHTS